ncbi:MAG: glycosyltransferase [Planctomycetes bacterium]|nr:glycosyltransferase [Planctomycetota bacterium]MBU1518021.1 glycosyltransferase [Planctomycetota bacterium]MBU2458221.1 glycosyltransferase [Planctomycetota bacterium]MBU2596617.1 glycosyltransferase [Planctomycetota bacterium]
MRDGKIIIARLWPGYWGGVPSDADVVVGINPEKYQTIIIHLTKNSSNPNTYEQKGKKVFYLTDKSSWGYLRFLAVPKLATLLKKQGVDILHCHKHKSTIQGVLAAKLAGVPIIIAHVHGLGRTRNIKRKLLNFLLLRYVDKILAVGEATRKDILQSNPSIKPEKVINIGNSIDLDYFSSARYNKQTARRQFGVSENSFVFATAGRLAPTKGQHYLISAFARIKKQLTNAELLIVGTGELKDELAKQAADWGCDSSVHFLGRIKNMPEFYSAIDVFVLPSVAEGLPRTLIEAMAAGVLCIASDIGSIPEILDNGRLGLLVPAKNADALADAMLKTINMTPQEKETIIISAKEYIKTNYSHNVMIKRIEKIYDTLVDEKIRQ